MAELHVGAEVGLAADHDCRGVVVASHPDGGWLVYWTWTEQETWHVAGDLWLREEPRDSGYRPVVCRLTDPCHSPDRWEYTEVPGPEAQLAADCLRAWYADGDPTTPRDCTSAEIAALICDDVQALYAEMRRRGWLHSMGAAKEPTP